MLKSGCYDTRAAPGNGVCREARDGVCARYVNEDKTDRTSAGVIRAGAGDTCPKVDNDSSQVTGRCKSTKCDVTIGGNPYCSQCSKNDDHLVDGKCVAASGDTNNNCVNTNNQGTCTQCDGQSFMYQGGCYQTGNQNPGNTLCTAASEGKCTQAAEGYFVPPGADNTHQSVVSCGDAANGVTLGDKKYVGVANCAKCNAPGSLSAAGTATATCIECAAGFLHTPTGSTSCVTTCPEGYFEHTDSNTQKKTCQSCATANTGLTPAGAGVAGYAACTYASNKVTCTKCDADKYLKTTSDSTSCVEASECGSGFFPKADDKTGNGCAACSTVADGGIENCGECSLLPSASRAGAILITCAKCTDKKLSPLKDACLDSCPAGTYDSSNVRTPCHTSCSSCSDAASTSCTACYPGSVLSKSDNTKGTCIAECTGAFMTHCKTDGCTLDVGGSRYCDACEDGYTPIDGVCTAIAAGARDASGCKANDGKCTACTEANYALLSGGCYNTKALPGSAVCTQAGGNGQCQACANGQTYASGNCPACAEGCAKCQSSTSTCTECLAGYYLDSTASKCVKCDTDDSNIKGIPNCVSCAPPTTPPGPVTCYVTQEPTVDPADPSVNKGGLSSGAIAGISVAVIAVVGGLIGFLCWWFVCRGKA